MYNLRNYVEYKGNESKVTNGMHKVLAWSKKDGYYFTEFGFCVEALVIAIES
jgi:hypothetical protein